MLKEEEFFDFVRRADSSDVRETRIGYVPGAEKKALARYEKDSDNLVSLGRELAELEHIPPGHENPKLTETSNEAA